MGRPALTARAVPDLLERSSELATLARLLEQVARTSCGALCIVGGEAGVGKTALVRTFCALNERIRILWGECNPLFTPQPLGPLADIASKTGGELARIVAGRPRPYEASSALLNELGEGSATIVVLEDLQWADEATLDVVRLLSRRVDSLPALVIATYRDDELGNLHPLRFLLGEIQRQDSVHRIRLHRLSEEAVGVMALSAGVDAAELFSKTAGNAFFVTEALASGDEEIPSTVRDAVLARAGKLSSDARSLLDAVAVAPHQAELSLLEAVSPQQLAALGECIGAGVLDWHDGAVAFRHELARLAIEESIAPDRALGLHRRTLATLITSPQAGTDPARLAHHAQRANDDASLLRYGRIAGERAAALGAHREAAAQFARAVTVAGSLAPGDRADLLQLLAQEYLHVNRANDAIEAEERAIELYKAAGDTVSRGDALRRLSRLFVCGGRGAEAGEPIHLAISLLEQGPESRELALAHAGLGALYMTRDEGAATIAPTQRALEIAERVGDLETVLYALNSLGTMELLMGDAGGKVKLLRSLEMAEELGMDEHVGRAYINLAAALTRARMYDGLVELITRGIDYSLEHGLDLWRMWLLTSLAQVHLDRGDWSSAVDSTDAVLHGERGELPRVSALPVLATVRARRGDPDVWPPLEEAVGMADRQDALSAMVPVVVARLEAAWLEGRLEAVVSETETTFAKAVAQDAWWALGEIACWRRRAGIIDEIDPRLPEQFRAELEGDHARAAAAWSALGCEYEAALASAGSGDEELLRQSLVKLQRLGARPAAAMVARKLRSRGVRGIARGPRSSTLRNAAQLTVRELEVLELVKAGLRNAEIASRLFLTAKTVDHHVSAILRKLGVESRGQAAREGTRLGLLN